MGEYPDIADHGLIGDLQTAALVDTNGTIDWFCSPRFDSPSIFGSLLDAERGGYCGVRPTTTDYVTRQLYLPNTAILITRFMTEEGVGEVVDFMPIAGNEATERHRLARMIRVVRGTMTFEGVVKPKFDYGRVPHTIVPAQGDGVKFVAGDQSLTVHRVGDPVVHGSEQAGHIEFSGDGLRISGTLNAGEITGVILETGGAEPSADVAGGLQGAVPRDHALLAGVDQPIDVPRSLARDRRPVGDDPQAHDVCPDRRARRRPDRGPARAGRAASGTGTTGTRGSATPRSRSTRCSASATPRRPRRSSRG